MISATTAASAAAEKRQRERVSGQWAQYLVLLSRSDKPKKGDDLKLADLMIDLKLKPTHVDWDIQGVSALRTADQEVKDARGTLKVLMGRLEIDQRIKVENARLTALMSEALEQKRSLLAAYGEMNEHEQVLESAKRKLRNTENEYPRLMKS